MTLLRTKRRARRDRILAGVAISLPVVVLAACGGGGGGGSGGGTTSGSPSSFTYLTNTENTTIPAVLTTLSKTSCSAANKALPLQVSNVPQASLDQKLQLLAGQNALPVQYAAGGTPQLTAQLYKAGDVVNFQTELTKLGVLNMVEPSAIDTIKKLYGGQFDVIPYEYNIEGFWYNKKIFAAHGLTVPQTWPDLVSDAAKLKAAGILPLSASGQQGWPLTRLISGYLYRDLGPDALQKVASGQAKLTDPQYVAAAQQVANLGKAGDFGPGVGSIDYNTSVSQFLTGKAGMMYMGSWLLANINSSADTIGAQNIGFFPVPAVPGGQGSVTQFPSNVGLPMTMNAKQYDSKVGSWLKCITQNYGSVSLKTQGTISGFRLSTPVTVDPLTKLVQNDISSNPESVLWFEALFNTQATNISQNSAAQLADGSISAQQFMSGVQTAQAAGS
jgi:raffinose/stachyose/melibiose transport system substrate-binding protein